MKNALLGAGEDEGITVGELVVTGGVEESRFEGWQSVDGRH